MLPTKKKSVDSMEIVGEGNEEEYIERQLDAAEEAVCELMKTTKSTLDELQNIPNCDHERLKSLAGEFVGVFISPFHSYQLQ